MKLQAHRLAYFEFFRSGARRRIINTAYSAPREENPNYTQTMSLWRVIRDMNIRQKLMRWRYALFSMLFFSVMFAGSGSALAAACTGGSFLGFPPWYKYLQCTPVKTSDGTNTSILTPQLNNINDVWLIGAAVLEIMLRLAALAAVGLVIWGGIQYITSQGESDKTTKARGTILNAVIGLVIAIISAWTVNFIAGRFN